MQEDLEQKSDTVFQNVWKWCLGPLDVRVMRTPAEDIQGEEVRDSETTEAVMAKEGYTS